MASTAVKLVIDDPENFHLLTTDMKEEIIQGGIATVNIQAALTRKNAIENIKSNFIVRNNFTTSQVKFTQMEKKRLISLSAIESRVGITEKAAYMARQETGGPHRSENGSGLAIPTNLARGGNKGSPVQKTMYLTKVKKLKGKIRTGTFRSKLVAGAYVASEKGILMRYNDKLFSVNDWQRKADKKISFKINEIYGFDKQETITPEKPWLRPASEKPAKDVENIFISQMKKRGM
jgi:hypothetical protein